MHKRAQQSPRTTHRVYLHPVSEANFQLLALNPNEEGHPDQDCSGPCPARYLGEESIFFSLVFFAYGGDANIVS